MRLTCVPRTGVTIFLAALTSCKDRCEEYFIVVYKKAPKTLFLVCFLLGKEVKFSYFTVFLANFSFFFGQGWSISV